MGMLYEYEGFDNFVENLTGGNNMVLDIRCKIVNGEKVIEKFAPTTPEPSYKVDDDGYMTFNLKNFAWQEVDTFVYDSIKLVK